MEDVDLTIRNRTYALFVELGRAPTAAEVHARSGMTLDEVHASWRRLHDVHALVLHTDANEIRMANPFSAVPTAHRVEAAGRWWYANCAWDAIGVCAALHVEGRVETSCPDCGEPIAFQVANARPSVVNLLFHCLVPAAKWWADITFT